METGVGKAYQDGEIIVRQGEMGDCMYIVQEGSVELLHRRGSQEFCLGILERGDFFGEMGVLAHEVRPVTVRAVGQARVLTLEKRTFIQRMHEDPSFVFKIVRKMSRRIRQLEEMLVRSADGSWQLPAAANQPPPGPTAKSA